MLRRQSRFYRGAALFAIAVVGFVVLYHEYGTWVIHGGIYPVWVKKRVVHKMKYYSTKHLDAQVSVRHKYDFDLERISPKIPLGSRFGPYAPEWAHTRKHGYVIPNKSFCDVREDVFMLVMVMSDPRDQKSRQFFRDTFGSVKKHRGNVLRILYAIGRTTDKAVEARIGIESEKHGDIVKFDMMDSYENFTLKSILTLKWTATYCNHAEYYMKVGQDVIVNFRRIVDHLIGSPSNHMVTGVLRNRGGRTGHHLRGAPWPRSPEYIIGHITIQSIDTIKPSYLESLRHPLFCEDQFLSFIFTKLNFSLIDNQYFRACSWHKMLDDESLSCDLLQVLSVHTQPFHGAGDWTLEDKLLYWRKIQPTSPESQKSCDRQREWKHDNRHDCNYLAPEP